MFDAKSGFSEPCAIKEEKEVRVRDSTVLLSHIGAGEQREFLIPHTVRCLSVWQFLHNILYEFCL